MIGCHYVMYVDQPLPANPDGNPALAGFVDVADTPKPDLFKAAAQAAFLAAQPELQRGVTKGVLHRNTVARKLSRLSARIKSL